MFGRTKSMLLFLLACLWDPPYSGELKGEPTPVPYIIYIILSLTPVALLSSFIYIHPI